LLLPPYFQDTIAAEDKSIRVSLPSGAFAPLSDCYVVDLLQEDATFKERMRVIFADPSASRFSRMEFVVFTRHSTFERDTEAMLGISYIQLHTIPNGSVVAARKGY
jgi:hypothetical protein